MKTKPIIAVLVVLILIVALAGLFTMGGGEDVAVGSKHFTEQKILGNMIAQLIEAHTDLSVKRQVGLQGTKVCFGAIAEGDVDIYPEYTGTGLVNILEEDFQPGQTPQQILEHVRQAFKERWDLLWLEPLGFDNTYAFAMREDQAEELGIKTISDLEEHAAELKPGFDHEFTNRPEWKRFEQVYGFTFAKSITKLAPDLTYKALQDGSVDIIDAFATDGRIEAYDLRVLEDDKNLFPPYDSCILVRQDALDAHPELRDVLGKLAGTISADEMRVMNYAVTDELKPPADVARDFLQKKGLLAKPQ
ncbi:MAG: glycine betaine ABC transporter substrate-binding protein [Planctomycetota bacterium]